MNEKEKENENEMEEVCQWEVGTYVPGSGSLHVAGVRPTFEAIDGAGPSGTRLDPLDAATAISRLSIIRPINSLHSP